MMSEPKHLLQRSGSSKKAKGSQLQPPAGEVGHSIATQALGPDSLGQTIGAQRSPNQMQQLQLLAGANAHQAEMLDGAFSSGHRWVEQPDSLERSAV